MTEKLIIENQTDMPIWDALSYAQAVTRQGRISNDGENYCYGTRFRDGIIVYAVKNAKSDRLVIMGEHEE